MKNIVIRKAREEDLVGLTDIYNGAIKTGECTGDMVAYSYGERKKWLDEHLGEKYTALVAESGNQLVGYGTLSPYRKGRQALDHVAEISIYIKKGFCGEGIGTSLLRELEIRAKSAGITITVAYIFKTNVASQTLFSRNGYLKWGELPDVVRQKKFTTSHVIYGKKL